MKLFSVRPQSPVSEPPDRNRIQTLKHGKSPKPESLVFQRHWRGSLPGLSDGHSPTQTHVVLCLFLCLVDLPSEILVPGLCHPAFDLKNSLIWMESFSHPISCLWKYRCQIPLSFCTVSVCFSPLERQGIPKTGDVCLNVPFVFCSS